MKNVNRGLVLATMTLLLSGCLTSMYLEHRIPRAERGSPVDDGPSPGVI